VEQLADSFISFFITDLFTGYGLYTLAFVVFTLFRKPGKMLISWDESANLLIRWTGIAVLLYSLVSFFLADRQSNESISWYPWIQFFIWIVASQLLWITIFRANRLLRLLVGFAIFFSFEKFVIITTSMNRDFLPSDDVFLSSPVRYWIAIALALITKAVTFVVFIYVLTYLRSRWTTRKINQ
jgi:hypothetical protein